MVIQAQALQFNSHEIVERSFPLRFMSETPASVIEATIARWNQALATDFPGDAFFTNHLHEETVRLADGTIATVLVMYLHADNVAWDAYQSRTISMAPRVNATLRRHISSSCSVARIVSERQVQQDG